MVKQKLSEANLIDQYEKRITKYEEVSMGDKVGAKFNKSKVMISSIPQEAVFNEQIQKLREDEADPASGLKPYVFSL
jgi:hypothetical protein